MKPSFIKVIEADQVADTAFSFFSFSVCEFLYPPLFCCVCSLGVCFLRLKVRNLTTFPVDFWVLLVMAWRNLGSLFNFRGIFQVGRLILLFLLFEFVIALLSVIYYHK